MNLEEFIVFFNKIKPCYDEIKSSYQGLSDKEVRRYLKEYDLKLIRQSVSEMGIVGELIKNTNISSLYFSTIGFVKKLKKAESLINFAIIEEKGELYINVDNHLIYFDDFRRETRELSVGIGQEVFLEWYLYYLALDFKRVFSRDSLIPGNSSFNLEDSVFDELIGEVS